MGTQENKVLLRYLIEKLKTYSGQAGRCKIVESELSKRLRRNQLEGTEKK